MAHDRRFNTVSCPGNFDFCQEISKIAQPPEFFCPVVAAFRPIPEPNAEYLSSTRKIIIAGLRDGTNVPSVSDGVQTVSFSETMTKLSVPESWEYWAAPPEAESPNPAVLFSNWANDLSVRLAVPSTAFGLELETNVLNYSFPVTASFFSGDALLGSITRSVTAAHGSRLFAAEAQANSIDRVTLHVEGNSGGFAVAQIRYRSSVAAHADRKKSKYLARPLHS